MWKKLALIILILAFISGFTVPSAEAGVKHRLKYLVALGLLPPPPVFAPIGVYPQPREYGSGHWEMTREWVPGAWERVWIPDHYDQWGRWVAGHYENRQTPGHYVEGRVWVEGYYR
jgi:hypothetical protein